MDSTQVAYITHTHACYTNNSGITNIHRWWCRCGFTKKKTIPSHYTHSRICSIELCTKRGCEETRKKIRISLFLSICEMQQHFLSLLFPPFLLILALFMAVAWKCLHENRKNNQRNLCDVIFVCAQLNADLLTVSVMPLFYLDRPLPCLAEIFCYCNCGRKQTQ